MLIPGDNNRLCHSQNYSVSLQCFSLCYPGLCWYPFYYDWAIHPSYFTTRVWHTCISFLCLVSQLCPTLCNPMDCSPRGSSIHRGPPGKNTGVGYHALFQGIFPIQGLNPGLPHCRQILCQLSHKGSPRILEWIAYPFTRGSAWPRNQTGVFCIAGRLLAELPGKP